MARHRLSTWGEIYEYELVHRSKVAPLDEKRGEVLLEPFASRNCARAFLERHARGDWNRQVLYAALAENFALALDARGEDEVIDRLAGCLTFAGSMKVIRRPSVPPAIDYLPPPDEKKKTAPAENKNWIKIRVVDDESDKVIADVKLEVRPSDGAKHKMTTASNGKVELDPTTAGKHEVTCDLSEAVLKETLVFVTMGDVGPGTTQKPGTRSTPPEDLKGTCIALVRRHKVKTGETLATVAKTAGMTWQALAKFNWGTSEISKVNEYLIEHVGCIKKGAEGLHDVFEDENDPGILFIPSVWKLTGLEVRKTHTIRVKKYKLDDYAFSL